MTANEWRGLGGYNGCLIGNGWDGFSKPLRRRAIKGGRVHKAASGWNAVCERIPSHKWQEYGLEKFMKPQAAGRMTG